MQRTWCGLAEVTAAIVALAPCAFGEAWPAYLHDARRSGVSAEALPAPLALRWTFVPHRAPVRAWGEPQPKPVEGNLELPRLRFDDAFHAVAADGLVCFASSADDTVYALDAETGRIRWEFAAEAPFRMAPSLWEGKVYAGCDDGRVYCLDGATGALVWRFEARPRGDLVLGHGRMMSLWPVRTGILIDGGVAYFAAGLFPGEELYLYALDARTGAVVWKNDTYAQGGKGTVSPQGYLVASKDILYVPSGRAMPAAFSRADGAMLFHRNFNWRSIGLFGGTYTQLAGDLLLNGTEQILAVRAGDGQLAFTDEARCLVLDAGRVYLLDGKEIVCCEEKTWAAVRTELLALKYQIDAQRSVVNDLRTRSRSDKNLLDQLAQALARAEQFAAKRAALLSRLGEAVHWRAACALTDCLVLAKDTALAGGEGAVMAFAGGRRVWSAEIEGRARSIAVSDGRVLVSTDRGAILCFGRGDGRDAARVRQEKAAEPLPADAAGGACAKAVERAIRESGVTRGFVLIAGGESVRCALELSRRTALLSHVIEPDAARAEAARHALGAAGVYGDRAVVLHLPYAAIPCADYFANLIMCTPVEGEIPLAPGEVLRMLKPCGGVAFVGLVGEQADFPGAALGNWTGWMAGVQAEIEAGGDQGTTVEVHDTYLKAVRGALKGAGTWLHQYGDPGNTACGDDERIRGPLGVLWFGDPGPGRMPSRHSSNVAPLAAGGRMFVQGENIVMAYDAYNGLCLWERELPGAQRLNAKLEASNIAGTEDGVFVVIGDKCLLLDPASGETRREYAMPPAAAGAAQRWGFVACAGDMLFGSRMTANYLADRLFALDRESGATRWVHDGKRIMHATIAIGDGKVFFVERDLPDALKDEALRGVPAETRVDRLGKPVPPDVRLVVALDARDGAQAWARPQYVADCVAVGSAGGDLTAMYARGVLLLCAQPWNGHFWQEFYAGEFSRRSLIALDGAGGSLRWSDRKGYRSRPLIVGDTIIAEPWAHDLATGEVKRRPHPVTGASEWWQISRPGHHCGCMAAAPHMLFFRSGTTAFYDLDADFGTVHFGAHRIGCWINCIPANGVVLAPEASSGCVCPFALHTTITFAPREENRMWGVASAPGPVTPVRRLAVAFGAPGDRRDSRGTLWLAYPRPGSDRLVLQLPIETTVAPGGGFAFRTARELEDGDGWVVASRGLGVTRCAVPVNAADEAPGEFTVALHFAELDGAAPGERVFDVKLQGRTAVEKLDVAAEAGGPFTPLVKEWRGVIAGAALRVELVPRGTGPVRTAAPILSAIEIERTRTLPATLVPPVFVLSDVRGEARRELRIVNHSDTALAAVLAMQGPEGFALAAERAEVNVPPRGETAVPVTARVGPGVAAGVYLADFTLRANDAVVSQASGTIRHAGATGAIAFEACADAHVHKLTPARNLGGSDYLLVDGGDKEMGDKEHAIGFISFALDVPGTAVSATLRLRAAPVDWAPTGDAGRVHLVEEPIAERAVTYETQPALGPQVGTLGALKAGQTVECPLALALEGRTVLTLALVPVNCDGAGFVSREGAQAPELIVTFGQ